MSARPCRLLLPIVFLAGCQPGFGRYFDSLTDAWAEQTLDVAGSSINAALMIAGMTSELCQNQASDGLSWADISVQDTLNGILSEPLLEAMGGPVIAEINEDDDSIEIVLEGVVIGDRESAVLRFVPTSSGTSFSLTAEVRDGQLTETFGSLSFTIADCSGDANWVTGNAKWTDLSDVDHAITIPTDETDIGLQFDCAYAPIGGTLAWSGTIDDQLRQFASSEADEIWGEQSSGSVPLPDTSVEVDDCLKYTGLTTLEWAGTVSGGIDGWSTTTTIDILP